MVGLAALVAACGGKVEVERSGAGGAGGTPNPGLDCEANCAARAQAGCAIPGDCVDACVLERGYAGICAPQFDAKLKCEADLPEPDLCATDPMPCSSEAAALEACIFPPGQCVAVTNCHLTTTPIGGPMSVCARQCGDNVYETACTDTPPTFHCTCKVNGADVATCDDSIGSSGFCCDASFAQAK